MTDFRKMHGLGNDFVVLDGRASPIALSPAARRRIAHRRLGVGCDQLVVLAPPPDSGADLAMCLYNADGGEIGACGNATRCVARLLFTEGRGADDGTVVIASAAARLRAWPEGPDVGVDMGAPAFTWDAIPLSRAVDPAALPLPGPQGATGFAVSMGNPHAVFLVPDAEAVPLETWGPGLETDGLFPERANISVASVTGPGRLRVRVWERGAGVTWACGTAACAAAVAAMRTGHLDRDRAQVDLDGGALAIAWREDGGVTMTGPTATSFTGTLGPELMAESGA